MGKGASGCLWRIASFFARCWSRPLRLGAVQSMNLVQATIQAAPLLAVVSEAMLTCPQF